MELYFTSCEPISGGDQCVSNHWQASRCMSSSGWAAIRLLWATIAAKITGTTMMNGRSHRGTMWGRGRNFGAGGEGAVLGAGTALDTSLDCDAGEVTKFICYTSDAEIPNGY